MQCGSLRSSRQRLPEEPASEAGHAEYKTLLEATLHSSRSGLRTFYTCDINGKHGVVKVPTNISARKKCAASRRPGLGGTCACVPKQAFYRLLNSIFETANKKEIIDLPAHALTATSS